MRGNTRNKSKNKEKTRSWADVHMLSCNIDVGVFLGYLWGCFTRSNRASFCEVLMSGKHKGGDDSLIRHKEFIMQETFFKIRYI